MESSPEDEYAAFLEKVKRTIYLDNLSPLVTESVIRTGFEQYGTVKNIHFIPNYVDPHCTGQCVLLELKTAKEAAEIIETVSKYPFMISGMPRPVRARPAEPEMFEDRPPKPGRRIQFYWLDRNDTDFGVAQEMKNLVRKHTLERSLLLKKQQEEEEKLSKQQNETVKGHYQKYEALDSVHNDLKTLSRCYGMNVGDDN